jgi:drug/metabolite transporter (DMT)-like permease
MLAPGWAERALLGVHQQHPQERPRLILPVRHNPIVGVLWMAGAAVSFSVALALVRQLSLTFSVFEIAFFRLVFGIIVMLPWIIRVGRAGLRTENFRFYAVRAVFSFAAVYSGYYSITLIPIADAVALQFTLPILTAVFAVIALKEPLYTHRVLAVILGFGGVLIIIRPGFADVNIGVLIALGAAVLFAGIDVSTRFLSGKDPVNVILVYGFALQLPIAAVPTVLTWVTPGVGDTAAIAVFVVSAMGAQVCITRSFAAAEASLVSPVLYMRLPLVALIGFVFFEEIPSAWTWVGAAILFAVTYYSTWRDTQLTRRKPAA